LYRLQQLDTQIDQLKARIQVIQSEIKDDSSVRSANQQHEQASQRLHKKQSEIRSIEGQAETIRIKLEQNQASLYGGKIKNPKELQDLQQEATALRRQLSTVEDELLELMISAEELQSEVETTKALLENAQSKYTRKSELLATERTDAEREIDRLSTERDTVAQTAPPDELTLYRELRNKRRGVAVARVVDGACSACGSNLNSALLQQAKSPLFIAYCETCSRILYAG
jgi:predicted  nucleic acid-binding Zn-ribbon protein